MGLLMSENFIKHATLYDKMWQKGKEQIWLKGNKHVENQTF